jgi:CheY-like chemotaxis protein
MKTKAPLSKHKAVMLIDDNDVDNFINEKIIKGYYFADNVYIHSSSKSALEFFKNLEILKNVPAELIPDYIFLDINMPIADGFHFLDEFEKLSLKWKSSINIVMLTTSLNPLDVAKVKSFKRVVKFLHKPLTEMNLADLE